MKSLERECNRMLGLKQMKGGLVPQEVKGRLATQIQEDLVRDIERIRAKFPSNESWIRGY